MKQTKTTLKELTAAYRAVLRHGILCNAIALGLIAVAQPAMANIADTDFHAATEGGSTIALNNSITGEHGKSKIWNEGDGGGSMFIGNDGITSYVGVHDAATAGIGAGAQIYVAGTDDSENTYKTILDATKNGIYYTVNGGTYSERAVAENEIATKGNIATAITNATATAFNPFSLEGSTADAKIDNWKTANTGKFADVENTFNVMAYKLADVESDLLVFMCSSSFSVFYFIMVFLLMNSPY